MTLACGEVGPLWWLYDPTQSTRPNFIKGRIPRTKRTRATESTIPGRRVAWEASRSPANARTSQGLGARDEGPTGAIVRSNNSYIYLRAAETAASNRTHSRRGTATTGAEAGDRVTTSPRAAPPASARARIFCTAAARGRAGSASHARRPRRRRPRPPEPLRSQASLVTPVSDDDEVSAAFGCKTRECCSPLGSSSSSVTRGALLAAFFALRENICEITRVLHRQLLATQLLPLVAQ